MPTREPKDRYSRRIAQLAVAVVACLALATSGVARADADNSPPTACMEQSPASPFTGDTVTFTSCSSDPDSSVLWRFWDLDDDGSFDDAWGPTAARTSATPVQYTVRLLVFDDEGGWAVASRTVTVANRAPVAAVGFTPAAPLSRETITFTSSASDPDGTIASRDWDLDGDGQFDDADSGTVAHSFPTPGDHVVRLRVVDNSGAATSVSRIVTVANRAPSAAFGFSPAAPLSGETVTFTSTASDPDGSIASRAWDLDGDGAFDDGDGLTASHSFATPGDHVVRLKVVDNSGAATTATETLSVGNRPPVASLSYGPQSPLTGDEITFTATASDPDGTIASRGWDLDGDGAFDDGDGATATRAFTTPGDHVVRLRVVDDRGDATTTTVSVRVGERLPDRVAEPPSDPPPAGQPFDQSTPVVETIPASGPPAIEPLRFLDPFPVVRIRGRTTAQGARVSLFTVTGPPGALVRLRCGGRGCPLSSAKGTVRSTGGSRGLVRFRRIEKPLRAGVVLTVLVTNDGFVGKHTRLVIRRLGAPRRTDRCLMPGSLRPRPCPPR